jgi:hypothetical protein
MRRDELADEYARWGITFTYNERTKQGALSKVDRRGRAFTRSVQVWQAKSVEACKDRFLKLFHEHDDALAVRVPER